MAYRTIPLGALIKIAPDKAEARLLELFRKHAGSTGLVATACGIDRTTLRRWIVALDRRPRPRGQMLLRTRVDAIRAEYGQEPAA